MKVRKEQTIYIVPKSTNESGRITATEPVPGLLKLATNEDVNSHATLTLSLQRQCSASRPVVAHKSLT